MTRWQGARRGRCLPYSGDIGSLVRGQGGVARSLSILTCNACRGKSCERKLKKLSSLAPPSSAALDRAHAPLANGACARSSAADDGGARDDNFFNFLSQLLPRHALQVSIDKERATPPCPLTREPISPLYGRQRPRRAPCQRVIIQAASLSGPKRL